MNFLEVDVTERDAAQARVANAALDPIAVAHKGRIDGPDKGVLGIRLQHVNAEAAGQSMLHGKVHITERLGTETVANMTL